MNMPSSPPHTRKTWLMAALALWTAGSLLPAALQAQIAGMEATDFKVQLESYPPPNESQPKTLLEGAKAQPRPGGHILLTAAKVKSFSTNGSLEMVAEAPQSVFDSTQRTLSSTGPLQVLTSDAKFVLRGEGFLLRQTNGVLIISNRVHTVIRNVPGKTPKP
jgi:hypothetical protein